MNFRKAFNIHLKLKRRHAPSLFFAFESHTVAILRGENLQNVTIEDESRKGSCQTVHVGNADISYTVKIEKLKNTVHRKVVCDVELSHGEKKAAPI